MKIFDREDALAVQGMTLMAGNLVSKSAVFRHEMFFPVSFWRLLFVLKVDIMLHFAELHDFHMVWLWSRSTSLSQICLHLPRSSALAI